MIKYSFNIEIKNIMEKVYKYKIYELAQKNNILDIDKDLFKSFKVYFGSDMYDFVISLIPKGKDGYYYREMIAKYKNYTYPRLFDYLGNPLSNISYSQYGIRLWEEQINEILKAEISSKFNTKDFHRFIDENLFLFEQDIIDHVNEISKNSSIVIPFKDKDDLLPTLKSMILNKNLDNSWIYKFIDLDSVRDYMIKNSVAFSFYNEFDKVEDDLEYCVKHFFKYSNSDEVFNLLTQDMNFKYDVNIGLIKG